MIKLLLLICSLSFPLFANSKIHENVLICGICRDVETRLPYTIKIMEQIGELFDDYKIIVYENNSKDDTRNLLKNWKHSNAKVFSISEDVLKSDLEKVIVNKNTNGSFFRPEEIARARNIVQDIAMSKRFSKYKYIIWMDMDFKIPPKFEGIIETFQSTQEWDAVLAYGIDPPGYFWDWYAFRDTIYPLGSELLGNDWWYMPKQLKLDQKDDWYPVYSAFGGCGIYKKSSIKGCRYSAVVTEDLEKLTRVLIDQGTCEEHPQILKYLTSINSLEDILKIDKPRPNLPKIEHSNVGIILNDFQQPVIWRMSTFVYQYPSVCEHVPFHSSMIMKGHGKIFINPRLLFTYGG